MIGCVDTNELGRFLRGKLDPERIAAVDAHLRECPECKARAQARLEFREIAGALGASLARVADCPEYEELSAFIDGSVHGDRAKALAAHLNLCEPCFADVERMRELRSQASLRGTVVVNPGMSMGRAATPLGLWKRALAGIVVAGLAAMAVIWTFSPGKQQSDKVTIAKGRPAPVSHIARAPKPAPRNTPLSGSAPKQPVVAQNPDKAARPTSGVATSPHLASGKTLLRDGDYRVIERDDEIVLAKVDGTSIKTPLEARVMAAIEEKVRTGKIKLEEPVRVAMNTLTRDGENYNPLPTAPKLQSPQARMLLSDRPTLRWSKVELADSYRVLVTTLDGGVVVEQITHGNTFTLDRPLQRGQEYRWQVGVRFSEGDAWTNSAASKFAVISADDLAMIQSVRSLAPGSHLALGVAYESAGLQDEAAAEYRALLSGNPGSALARKMLRTVTGETR